MTYDKVTYAVLMATPNDLEEFAIGFALSEGIIGSVSDIIDFELAILPMGIECRMVLTAARREVVERRRRHLVGPMGCGLCGIDSLAEALKASPRVAAGAQVSADDLLVALRRLPSLQPLNARSHALHAAALFLPVDGSMQVFEDVGRHNALDKLIGAVRRGGGSGDQGIVLLTSRVSIDLIQKTAAFGASILVAVSVPSARAVLEADAAGITLVAVAREDGFEVFSHPQRIIMADAPDLSDG
jgi:FdhD protein